MQAQRLPWYVLLGAWGVVLLAVFGAGGMTVYTIARHIDAQHRYMATTGKVISSEMKVTSDSKSTSYSPKITYEYIVDGKSFTSQRDVFDTVGISNQKYAQARVASNPAGKEVTMFYDPDNPAESVLQLEIPGTHFWGLMFMQIFLFIMYPLARATARGRTYVVKEKQASAHPVMNSIIVYLMVCVAWVILLAVAQGVGSIQSQSVLVAWLVSVGAGLITFAILKFGARPTPSKPMHR